MCSGEVGVILILGRLSCSLEERVLEGCDVVCRWPFVQHTVCVCVCVCVFVSVIFVPFFVEGTQAGIHDASPYLIFTTAL